MVARYLAAAAVLSLCSFAGCADKSHRLEPWHGVPQIAPGPLNFEALVCWYVEDDTFGGHGYACVDSSRSVSRPDGHGLFCCLQDLRAELVRLNLNGRPITPYFRGPKPMI